MSKAAKQVIIILGVLLVLSIVVALSTFSQKASLQEANTQLQNEVTGHKKDLTTLGQAKDALTSENDKIKKQANEILDQKNKLEDEVNDLTAKVGDFESRLTQITDERNDWKQKYEKTSKQRDDAVAKLQEAEEKLSKAQEGTVISSGDPDKQLESHWAQVLKEKAELNVRISKLENDLNQSALNIEELKKKNSDLELEVSALKQQKDELDRQIKRRSDIADNISVDLVREKSDKKFVSDQFEKMKDENLALRAEVKELSAMKIVLEKSISKLQEDKSDIQKKLVKSETVVQDRLDDVLRLKEDIGPKAATEKSKTQEVMLPPIIVNGSSAKEPAEGQSQGKTTAGQVVSINKENNFVIIDLGQNSGVNIGDRLSVYRGDTYVGELEIIQVRTDISAADIKKQSMPIQAGDSVR